MNKTADPTSGMVMKNIHGLEIIHKKHKDQARRMN